MSKETLEEEESATYVLKFTSRNGIVIGD